MVRNLLGILIRLLLVSREARSGHWTAWHPKTATLDSEIT